MFRIVLATVLAASILAPSALAEETYTREWSFTAVPNTVPAGTFALSDASGGGSVTLHGGEVTTWADPNALAVAAPFAAGSSHFDLFFRLPGGEVTVSFGYVVVGPGDATEFFSLGSTTLDIEAVPRTVAGEVELPDGMLEIGRATGDIVTQQGTAPAGSFPALSVEIASGENDLYTEPGTLGSQSSSAGASIPLPEPGTLILTGIGFAAVAGVVLVRRK